MFAAKCKYGTNIDYCIKNFGNKIRKHFLPISERMKTVLIIVIPILTVTYPRRNKLNEYVNKYIK